MNKSTEERVASLNSEDWWKFGAVWAEARATNFFFADGAMIMVMFNDVIFTTIAKWRSDAAAPPTGMGCKEV